MAPTILILAGTSRLGCRIVPALIDRGVPASSVAITSRTSSKAVSSVFQNVEVRIADYNDAAAITAALKGIEKVLLISSGASQGRLESQVNVVQAVKGCPTVQLLAYTSLIKASLRGMPFKEEHADTEKAIVTSGVPHCFLRNGWYCENKLLSFEQYMATGLIPGASGQGRYSVVSRQDCAEAAAAVLAGAALDHVGKTYELGGHPGFNLDELASVCTKVTGKTFEPVHLSKQAFQQTLKQQLPEWAAIAIAAAEDCASRGELEDEGDQLETLIGRASTSIEEVVQSHYDAWKAKQLTL